MSYLVTGGTGLIGSRIVRDLVQAGEQVVAYDLFPQKDLLEQLLNKEEMTQVKIEQGDITDLTHLIHCARENDIDRVIHLVAMFSAASVANPPLSIKVNCEGTCNVFETARILGLKKVVWASSVSVFGPTEKYAEEYVPNDALHCPWGIYGAAKSFSETLAATYIDHYGLDISAIRYSFVYGTGGRVGNIAWLIRELIEKPVEGKPGSVPWGDDELGWLYVNDAARVTVDLSKVAKPKTKAFTVSGDVRPIKEAVDYVKSLLPGADITLEPGYMGVGWRYDSTPLEEEIGYRPQWSMEQGLKDVVNTVRQQHGLPPV